MLAKTAERGYGGRHQTLRKHWAAKVARGTESCRRCGGWIAPGSTWHLAHDPYDPTRRRYLGPMHERCNCDTRLEKVLRRTGAARSPAPAGRPPAEAWL